MDISALAQALQEFIGESPSGIVIEEGEVLFNLSDAKYSSFYAQGSVHTANGVLSAKPIVYAVTIPHSAAHKEWAVKYLHYLLGENGQRVMAANGFGTVHKALASDTDKVPAQLKPLTTPWPK